MVSLAWAASMRSVSVRPTPCTPCRPSSWPIAASVASKSQLPLAIAWCTPSEGIAAKLIRGDDSWILERHSTGPLVTNLDGFTSLFNFETKLLEHDGSIFYASSFFWLVQGHIRLVPDPLKSIIKLGRKDMHCPDHVSEYWVSFSDNHKAYLNSYTHTLEWR